MEIVLLLAALAFVVWLIRKMIQATSSPSTSSNPRPDHQVGATPRDRQPPPVPPGQITVGRAAEPSAVSRPQLPAREADLFSRIEATAGQGLSPVPQPPAIGSAPPSAAPPQLPAREPDLLSHVRAVVAAREQGPQIPATKPELLSRVQALASQLSSASPPSAFHSAPLKPAASPPISQWRWIPLGQTASVAGLSIPGGLLYVGKGLRAVSGVEAEPALISPDLPVTLSHPDLAGAAVSYWPSYADIPPQARAGYLLWLAQGRRNPDAYIGYVFLFFYGLERRVLGDHARQDIACIADEVRALLGIYKTSLSFSSYARRFLEVCAALTDLSGLDDPESSEESGEVSLSLKLQLSRLSVERRGISADLARRWLEGTSEIGRRAVVERCPAEFRHLFGIRYRERFGDGMVIEPNKTRLSLSYKPASRSFYQTIHLDIGDLPDVTVLQTPIKEFAKLADFCMEELDPYSRWLGKNPDSRGSIEAIALLPSAMAMGHAGAEIQTLGDWLDATVTREEPLLLKRQALMERWPGKRVEDWAERKAWTQVAKVLQMLGYGIEPDVRFQGLIGCRTEHVVLFKLGDEGVETGSPEYYSATLMARFGVVIADADGDLGADEMARLADMLEKKLELSPAERLRLVAHLKLLVAEGASLTGAKKRLEEIGQSQREAIAHVATLVALADGRVTKTESASLRKLYALLGLDPTRVYEDLHALGVDSGAADPDVVTVRPATGGPKGYSIPAPPKPEDVHRVVLDKARLEARAKETSEVVAILKGVFVDEESVPSAHPPLNVAGVAGLDSAHSALLRRLGELPTVGRADWESWCSQCDLLPDGAIDRINEAAWDTCGGPLLDGENTISVDQATLKEMLA